MSEFGSLIFYIVFMTLSSTFFSLRKSKNLVIKNLGIGLSIMIPSVIAGLRFNVGTDYKNYYWTFSNVGSVSYEWIFTDKYHFNVERVFLAISKLMAFVVSPKTVFGLWSFVILVIFVITLLKEFREYDIDFIFFSFLFLFYINSFNILRQTIALVIVFYSIRFVFRKKILMFLLTILFATLFHTSALLALPIYLIWDHHNYKIINFMKKWLILLGCIGGVILWPRILTLLATINFGGLTKYLGYLKGNVHSNRSFVIKLIILCIMLLVQKRLSRNDKKIDFFIYLFFIGTIIEFTGYYSSFIKRISIYYSVWEVIIFSRFMNAFSKNVSRLILKTVIILYFSIGIFVLRQGGLIPYQI